MQSDVKIGTVPPAEIEDWKTGRLRVRLALRIAAGAT
jgi:hypothetical protein